MLNKDQVFAQIRPNGEMSSGICYPQKTMTCMNECPQTAQSIVICRKIVEADNENLSAVRVKLNKLCDKSNSVLQLKVKFYPPKIKNKVKSVKKSSIVVIYINEKPQGGETVNRIQRSLRWF